MNGLTLALASPAASVAVGVISFAVLIAKGRHRDKSLKTASGKLSIAFLQGAALYTLVVALVYHWFLHIGISTTIQEGFGQDRFAWIFVGFVVDLSGRMFALYDPD